MIDIEHLRGAVERLREALSHAHLAIEAMKEEARRSAAGERTLRAELERRQEALRIYGDHKIHCAKMESDSAICDCGLDAEVDWAEGFALTALAALASPPPAEEPHRKPIPPEVVEAVREVATLLGADPDQVHIQAAKPAPIGLEEFNRLAEGSYDLPPATAETTDGTINH